MRNSTIDLSIVVPCFNEEEALPIFYGTVEKIVGQMNISYEYVYIDDGSRDRTLEIIRKLSSENSHVRYASFSRNFGKEAAIFAGLQQSRGSYVVLMDADLQDPPSYLPRMYEILQTEPYDNVAMRRSTRTGEPFVRSVLSDAFYKLINKVTDVPITSGARDYRMMKRKMVDSILAVGEYNRFSKGLFSWVGYRTKWLSYENIERVAGQSDWGMWKLIKYALEGIVNFSEAPLHIATVFGGMLTAASFIWAFILVLKRIIIGNYNVSGWTSTICVVLFLGGVQLLSIGIMGQYIARIFLETKRRPLFIIAESSDDGESNEEKALSELSDNA